MKLTTQPDETAYLAALILRLNSRIPNRKSRQFTKALILVASGILADDLKAEFTASHLPQFDEVLKDYTENFRELYPQYFQAVHPVFQQMTLIISKENHDYCDH
ncbi:hypothetical protein [Planktothrix agardhii]|uniref:hypothetical protein n=1 Tax=Planktothrix agardhii TaxID=1160 RepID=UPI001D0BC770|nr:hypothetical protein [Planktothrix agardhii]MCB8750718.1 hypothetical protein [Planktothrix agardhii 1810]MCF3608921.1 hypothetical protein [Planktothrix agardhii 1033]